jgi:orotate phosphoribosyltransferase
LIDRSGGTADIGVNLSSLAAITVETFSADDVPEDLSDIPAVKPGSRGLK